MSNPNKALHLDDQGCNGCGESLRVYWERRDGGWIVWCSCGGRPIDLGWLWMPPADPWPAIRAAA